MTDYKSKYLAMEWDIPFFVKLDPNYENLFELEAEILMNEAGKFGVKYEDCEEVVTYNYASFFDLYKAVENTNNYSIIWSKELGQIVFKDYMKGSTLDDAGWYSVPTDETEKYFTPYFSSNGASSVEILVSDYKEWKKMNEELDPNSFTSENFYNIYQWLDHHPDFWRQERIGKAKKPYWETSKGAEWLETFPFIEDGNEHPPLVYDPSKHEIRWRVQGGSHVIEDKQQPDLLFCSTSYWDPFIYGDGKTYEEAFLDFAKEYFIKRPWTNDDRDKTSEEEKEILKRFLRFDELDDDQ